MARSSNIRPPAGIEDAADADDTDDIAARLIVPDWPAPANVRALSTTRLGGVSQAPYDSFNLGVMVGDNLAAVTENRRRLAQHLPSEPVWLSQVHGARVLELPQDEACAPLQADASWTWAAGPVCAVQTADCLPVLFCDAYGSAVGAAHAGWRGLAAGVLENTVRAMSCPPERILAWLGPAIGRHAFEVGDEVRQAFVAAEPQAALAFHPGLPGKWFADIFMLARQRLAAVGVTAVYGGDQCTYSDPPRFFSYRRDHLTGRQASLIWLEPEELFVGGTPLRHNRPLS